eukprot:1155584-Pelagomonas_calceolata.AAC.2
MLLSREWVSAYLYRAVVKRVRNEYGITLFQALGVTPVAYMIPKSLWMDYLYSWGKCLSNSLAIPSGPRDFK